MVVDQGVEAVALAAVPDVPDERPVVEQLAVLLEEAVAEPVVEVALPASMPHAAEQPQQPLGRGFFAADRRDADDAVVVGELRQFVAPLDQRPRPLAQAHLVVEFRRPAVAQQPRNGDLERRAV